MKDLRSYVLARLMERNPERSHVTTISFNRNSYAWQLRDLACRLYREQFGDELQVLTLHAGLECGMFAAKKAHLDILSIGPNCENFHSVSEKLSISSTRKFFRFLLLILEHLK